MDIRTTARYSVSLFPGFLFRVEHLNIIDLSSDSVVETLKELTAEEEYRYQYNYDPIAESDTVIVENLVQHFLDLIESPNNPLNSKALERTAAVYTSINIINRLFLSVNDIIELSWLEREFYLTNKTKWDGVLFKVDDHKISPGFVEFSGGANDSTTATKERRDIKKLYSKMIDVINQYSPEIEKRNFCFRFYENTIFFEELRVYKQTMFRIQHVAITIPTTIRLLVKFTEAIPKMIAWKNAVVKHVEQF